MVFVYQQVAWKGSSFFIWPAVYMNFTARAAWAGIAHHPKIIRSVTTAFIITNTNNLPSRTPLIVIHFF
jgi:hypothetical protein